MTKLVIPDYVEPFTIEYDDTAKVWQSAGYPVLEVYDTETAEERAKDRAEDEQFMFGMKGGRG